MKIISFITYTKGAVQYVTTAEWETQFLNWLNEVGDSTGYKRATHSSCGLRCSPITVHEKKQQAATVLKLVRDEGDQ